MPTIERILLSSKGNAIRKSEVVAGQTPTANADIRPGELIEFDGSYNASPQSTAAEVGARFRVAVPNVSVGMSIDDKYSTSGNFQGLEYASVPPGDEVYAWLANGENVSVGDKLVTNGDGTLRQLDTAGGDDASSVVAEALEAVDATVDSSDERIKVEVV